MPAEDSLREGNVAEALAQLKQQVRSNPSDAKLRTFLFQLLAISGDWDRALAQLNVAGELDDGTLAMVQAYREALSCEALRQMVFQGQRSPLVFGDPEPWIAMMIEATRLTADGKHSEAQQLRNNALESAPATSGTIQTGAADSPSVPFEWIADADSRLGPILEVIVNGRYYWTPFNRIQRIQIEEPVDLRDMIWLPAFFTWANGGETFGMIPTRYPGSEAHEDGLVQLARKTEWIQQGDDVFLGLGQRLLATDQSECGLLDVREIVLNTSGDGDLAPDANTSDSSDT